MLEVRTESFETLRGERKALVFTPDHAVKVGRERLDDPTAVGLSEVDRALLSAAREYSGKASVVVFRGRGDGEGSWGFAEDLRPDEADRLAKHMLQQQVVVYRGFMKAGFVLNVHTDFGETELTSFRRAANSLRDSYTERLKTEDIDARRLLLESDSWMLKHLVFFFGSSFRTMMKGALPDMVPLMERRLGKVQTMLADVPDAAIGLDVVSA